MRGYWWGFIKQRGFFDFFYLCWRKLICIFLKLKFKSCKSIMLSGKYQINGYRFIKIGKLSAGNNFRMEAISHFQGQVFLPEIDIGCNVSFGNDVHIGCISNLKISSNALFGSNISIVDHDHGIYSGSNCHSSPDEPPAKRRLQSSPIVIGENVHVGDSVVILKGVTIGAGAIIGAGSVVTRSVPDGCLAAGNPVRVLKRYDVKQKEWVKVNSNFKELLV